MLFRCAMLFVVVLFVVECARVCVLWLCVCGVCSLWSVVVACCIVGVLL